MSLIWIFITIGGLIGSYLPVLLGASGFSFWSIIGGVIGSIVGIWAFRRLDI